MCEPQTAPTPAPHKATVSETPPPPAAPAGPAVTATPPPDEAPPAGTPSADTTRLNDALLRLRSVIESSTFPLRLPSAEQATVAAEAVRAQLDDYLLPRLRRLDAPLLVVVGGSTGAGKSTLVNSLIRTPVSTSGVLRPTTRCPVLVCHPDDAAWFRTGDLLPGLTRTSTATNEPGALQLVPAQAMPAGLALLDAPDIDSVVDANRALAGQLLAAADLWLFVTTAARYADAVPWQALRGARSRGTAVALVLDRVPTEAQGEVADHLREMLTEHELAAAPLFVLAETEVDGHGLLPDAAIAPLRGWLNRLADDATVRATVVRQTLDGALAALTPTVETLAAAAEEQARTATDLTVQLGNAREAARGTIDRGVRDGALLRGEVLTRWQEFVGTGELLRTLEAHVGRARDRLVAALTGRPAPGKKLRGALESSLVALLRGAAADAVEQAYTTWQTQPGGAALLDPSLARTGPTLDEQVQRLVRDWQRAVLELVRTEGASKRSLARGAAYAVNATSLAVMIAVFASTAFLPTGLEVAAAGGTTIAGQKLLEAIFGDQAIRTLAGKARGDLLHRADALLEQELARFGERLPVVADATALAHKLRFAASEVAEARDAAGLTVDGPVLPAWEGDA